MPRAQGLPITIIIVAAIALVVLVVLIAIFTGRMGLFAKISPEAESKLAELRLGYANCRPSSAVENRFLREYSAAKSDEDKEKALTDFEQIIAECAGKTSEEACTGNCRWAG